MGYCKPGITCLHHGSVVPDADTTIQTRTPPPGPVAIPYPSVAERRARSDRDQYNAYIYDLPDSTMHAEPAVKPHVAVPPSAPELDEADKIIAACESAWPKNKKDCNHFLKAVQKIMGWEDFGPNDNANAIVALCEKSPKYSRVASAAEAKKLADEGAFVIAGLRGEDQHKKSEHGHVAIVTKGPLHNGAPTGYWGSLGGTPKENSSLRWAWIAEDMKNVEFFVRK